jgi:two-component system chemotaxis response regulator CheB
MSPPEHRDVIVVGASAGGVEALRVVVAGLPQDLAAAVLVVLHMPAGSSSALSSILRRAGRLPAVSASGRDVLRPGTITVAPPDHHLLVEDGHTVLSRGPTESGHRPAVDALFRSAARARGSRVIGVVLSGALDDGAAGSVAIAAAGGLVAVQDPAEALYAGMPESVLRLMRPDHVLPAQEMGPMLARRTAEPIDAVGSGIVSELDRREAEIALQGEHSVRHDLAEFGELAGFACPDCQGVLLRLKGTERFRCRVGHAWTVEALLAAQGGRVQQALWTAYRMLEERAELAQRMEASARRRSSELMASRHAGTLREARDAASVLRGLLLADLPTARTVDGEETSAGGPVPSMASADGSAVDNGHGQQ